MICVTQDRHHQTARRTDRDTDVEVAVINDVVTVDRRVHERELLQRMHGRLHEERHEAELHAVFLLEAVLVLVAQIHDRRHVDFVERRQDGVGLLRFEQTLGDARAQTRHRHALFRTVLQPLISRCGRAHLRQRRLRGARRRGGGSRCGGLRSRRGSRSRSRSAERIALRDAAVAARARNLVGRNALLGQDLRRGRRCRTAGRCLRRGRSLCDSRFRDRRGLHFGVARSGDGGRRVACFGFGVDLRDEFVGGDDIAVVLDDLRQHASRRSRHFEHDFVGLDFDEDFVLGDSFTRLLLPLQHGRFRDRLGKLRNLDFYDSHFCIFLMRVCCTSSETGERRSPGLDQAILTSR
ncbi:hypothetical protein AWB82_07008 [Caballeronia glebae]|uniref:Uncharacterized protein n=1 Tax=Caballeronia glebae TaxID=1777143 RepID=A0A158DNR6_9BURK|nr:hypothetical protein AWB82_07008 [Caballeronia glebae]